MSSKEMGEARKIDLANVAVRLAATHGYTKVTRNDIAAEAHCSPGLVSHHLGTMPQLRRTVMRLAIRTRNLKVIAQGLAANDPHALKAPLELKQAAVATLAG